MTMQNFSVKHRDGFPALMNMLVAYGESYIVRSAHSHTWQADWENSVGQDSSVPILSAGIDMLADRLRSMRQEMMDWGCRVWEESVVIERHVAHSSRALFLEKLRLLDDLVFLLIGSKRNPLLQEIRFDPISARLNQLYGDEEAFYRCGSWRFIPFNIERRERLGGIPSKQWYLFPWYKEWSDIPPQSLDLLIESMAGHPVDTDLLSPAQLEQLGMEIEEDPQAAAILAKHVFLARELPVAVAQSYVLPVR